MSVRYLCQEGHRILHKLKGVGPEFLEQETHSL